METSKEIVLPNHTSAAPEDIGSWLIPLATMIVFTLIVSYFCVKRQCPRAFVCSKHRLSEQGSQIAAQKLVAEADSDEGLTGYNAADHDTGHHDSSRHRSRSAPAAMVTSS